MPGRDGTGPMGRGAMSGRGLGLRAGYGCRRGFGRPFTGETVKLTDKEILTEQREWLQRRLDIVSKQLENLSEVHE